jgi:hypothetical protein
VGEGEGGVLAVVEDGEAHVVMATVQRWRTSCEDERFKRGQNVQPAVSCIM